MTTTRTLRNGFVLGVLCLVWPFPSDDMPILRAQDPTIRSVSKGDAKPDTNWDWSQWRGPNRDGISHETGWSTKWPERGPRILWRMELGRMADNRDGSSSVAVANGRVYVMGTGHVFCLDSATGKTIWKNPFPRPTPPQQ